MQTVPLSADPFQKLTISLGGQACQISLRQEIYGLFMDVYVNNNPIVLGVVCENRNRIVRDAYLGFDGDFTFQDKQGDTDPFYTGLGTRYVLRYLEPSDLLELAEA